MTWLERLRAKSFTIDRLENDGTGFVPIDAAYRGSSRVDSLDSNAVMSPVGWILRNFTEAEPVIDRRVKAQTWEVVDDHDAQLLMANPNPYYNGSLLWKASIVSYCLDGNAYWQKVRNRYGDVIGYWYVPHFLVQPVWPTDGSEFISYYRYTPIASAAPSLIPVRDMVHLRYGLDPRNVRYGLSPIKPVLREVFTDEEAASFSASILANMGVPGGIITPKLAPLRDKDEAKRLKDYLATEFTGNRRGGWMAFGEPTEVHQFGFDPNNLMLGNLRDIAEERVCAALGVPAAVVGFGAGLQQTKVGATMQELRKEAWNSCIRPMQNDIAKQLNSQVLVDFVAQTRRFRVRFDTSDFAASQEEQTEKATRISLLAEKGILRVDRAQEALGLEVDPTRQIYLGPSEAKPPETPATAADGNTDNASGAEEDMPPAVAARMNGNGNGNT